MVPLTTTQKPAPLPGEKARSNMEATEYSKAEWKLIDKFGLRYMAERRDVTPLTLYREMAMITVCTMMTGPAVEALRRALNALNQATVYRMTDEFDTLVTFGET